MPLEKPGYFFPSSLDLDDDCRSRGVLLNSSFHNYSRCWGPSFGICCTSMNFWALVFAYRICTEIGKLHLCFTRTRLLSLLWWVQCSCDGPHKTITAFAVTCLENWNKWEQTVSLPCTRCMGLFINISPFFHSLLCMEVLLHCMESWVGFQIWSWKASKEMASIVSEIGSPSTIMIAYECISQKEWNCQAKEGSFWTQDFPRSFI